MLDKLHKILGPSAWWKSFSSAAFLAAVSLFSRMRGAWHQPCAIANPGFRSQITDTLPLKKRKCCPSDTVVCF